MFKYNPLSMLSYKTSMIWIDMLKYSILNKNKTCLFFVSGTKEIEKLIKIIPVEIENAFDVHISSNMLVFKNGSKIKFMIGRFTRPEHIRGFEIDQCEEFGLADYDTWKELKRRIKTCRCKK